MDDLRGLAVHEVWGANDASSVDVANRLMTETHAEQWSSSGKCSDCIAENSRVLWSSWTGRKQNSIWLKSDSLVNGQLVITHHDWLGTELTDVLDQVVDE